MRDEPTPARWPSAATRASRACLWLRVAGSSPLGAQVEATAPRDAAHILAELREPGFAVRRDAVRACHGRHEPELLDALRHLVRHDPHPTIRAFAVNALSANRVPDLFAVASEALAREPDTYPGEAAIRALGACGDRRAFDLLVAQLEGRHAGRAALSLGAVGDARAFDPVATLLERDLERDGRARHDAEQAARALTMLDTDRGVDALLARFRDGARWAAVVAPALAEQPLPRVRKAMLAALDTTDPWTRRAAARVLEGVVDATCMGKLLDVFEHDPDMIVAIAPVLGRSGFAPAAGPLCARLLVEENTERRLAVAAALRGLSDPAIGLDLLRALARELDDRVRVQIVAALGKQGNVRVVAALMKLVDDPTFTDQPLELSTILGFPHNVRLGDVAVWAVAMLVEGKVDFGVEELSSFRQRISHAECAATRLRLQAWWKTVADRERYGGR